MYIIEKEFSDIEELNDFIQENKITDSQIISISKDSYIYLYYTR